MGGGGSELLSFFWGATLTVFELSAWDSGCEILRF